MKNTNTIPVEFLTSLVKFCEDAKKGIEIVPTPNTQSYWSTEPFTEIANRCCLIGAAIIGKDGSNDVSQYGLKSADVYGEWPILREHFSFEDANGDKYRDSVFSRIARINDEQGRSVALAAVERWIEIGVID